MDLPLTVVLVLFVGGMAGWALVAWRAENRRRQGLLSAGRPAGLRLDVNDPFDLPETYFGLHLFTRGHSRLAWNVLHGRIASVPGLPTLPARVFDYQYETGSGKNRRTHRWQVALVHTDLLWPALLCQPADQYDPLEAVFGLDPVKFEVDPFASRFRVACEDAQFAYRFLHARFADLLASHPDVTLETEGEVVAVYCRGPRPAAEAVALLDLAVQAIWSLPPSLREEMQQIASA